jgi:hypothetical protein
VKECDTCLANNCGKQEADCAADATCAMCLQPMSSILCFANERVQGLLGCACQSCAAKCPDVSCQALPCVECAAKDCPAETVACEKDPACAPCLTKNPPPSCAMVPLAGALFKCTQKKCNGLCGG